MINGTRLKLGSVIAGLTAVAAGAIFAATQLAGASNGRGEAREARAPNELGKVMVLMYHQIREPEGEWVRTPENFRSDLQRLYERGYTLVNLVDLVEGKINVPVGRTPVVLTFDDSAVGQFSKIDGKWSPNSAVGMIQGMYERHPEFGRAGSFYLNPDRRGSTAWSGMLKEMVEMGFELGNHTVTHPQLKKLDQAGVEREIAGLQSWVQLNVPGYVIKTMALPFGIYPKVDAWAAEGESRGVRYRHLGLLEVGAGPSVSPYSRKFKPLHIPRIRGSAPYFDQALKYFDEHPELRFYSDGDSRKVTAPERLRQELSDSLPGDLKVEWIP